MSEIELMSISQAAKRLQMDWRTAKKMVVSGQLRTMKRGDRDYVTGASVTEYLRQASETKHNSV